MKFALIQVCVDDRLDHNLLRAQIHDKLTELSTPVEHVFIVNELGGNFGANFRNTATMITHTGSEILMAALLHHDDCRAHQAGYRQPIEASADEMAQFLSQSEIDCILLTGHITTATNQIAWENGQRLIGSSTRP